MAALVAASEESEVFWVDATADIKNYRLHTDIVQEIQASMLESVPAWWSEGTCGVL